MGTITWTSPQSSGGQAGEYNFGATYSVSSTLNTNQVFPAGSTLTVSTWSSREYVVSFEDAWSGSTAQLYYGDATGNESGKTTFIDWYISSDRSYYLPNKVRSITYTTTRDCSQFYAKASNKNDGDGHGGAINFRVKLTLSYTSWTITLSRNNTSAGTVSGAGTYTPGNRTVTATTNSGYRFVGWYSGNTLKSSSASYTFNLTADISLEARWVQQYSITVNTSSNIYGSVSGGGSYDTGSSRTVTASTKSAGYFLGWYNGNTLLTRNLSYTFTLNGNVNYTARFCSVKQIGPKIST